MTLVSSLIVEANAPGLLPRDSRWCLDRIVQQEGEGRRMDVKEEGAREPKEEEETE
jgi:hypothetical protein